MALEECGIGNVDEAEALTLHQDLEVCHGRVVRQFQQLHRIKSVQERFMKLRMEQCKT